MCKDDSASSLMVGNGIEKQKQQQLYFVSSKCIVAAVHSFNLLIHWSGWRSTLSGKQLFISAGVYTLARRRMGGKYWLGMYDLVENTGGKLTGYVWVGNMGGKYSLGTCMAYNGWPKKLDPPGGERVWVLGGGEDVESSWVGLFKIIQGLYKLPGSEWSVGEHWHLTKILWISR